MSVRAACLGALTTLVLAACQPGEGPAMPTITMPTITMPTVKLPTIGGEDEPYTPPLTDTAALPAPAGDGEIDRSLRLSTDTADVPTVFMALEASTGRPTSVVFAIDASGDQAPGNDPAIRLTPASGECNPQELSRYRFKGDDQRPVFSRLQAIRGVDPARLPEYMAVTVSRRMIEQGLAETPEDTKPQNVCTRKLWERLVLAQTRAASGQ